MVCKLPSARSLSKARSEGALRENMAKADMSASAKAISVSPTRSSGRLAKPLCTKRKSASADRCFRPCGATMDMENPITRRSKRSSQGVFSHLCLRKASAADTVITRLGGSSGIADHLQKRHPDAGEFRIWSLLGNSEISVRTVGRIMALNRQVYDDIPRPQGAKGPKKPAQPHPYKAPAPHEYWLIDGRMMAFALDGIRWWSVIILAGY